MAASLWWLITLTLFSLAYTLGLGVAQQVVTTALGLWCLHRPIREYRLAKPISTSELLSLAMVPPVIEWLVQLLGRGR